jgi:hypothetical protein
VTVSGVAGFRVASLDSELWGIAIVGWMLLPAGGFVITGQQVPVGRWIYLGGGAGCLLGAGLYVAGILAGVEPATIAGLVLVGVGQTAGILDAAIRY